jgi:hypothetical protein
LYVQKNNLESTLNFERAPLKLQRAIKEKGERGVEGEGRGERMERGGGRVSLRSNLGFTY